MARAAPLKKGMLASATLAWAVDKLKTAELARVVCPPAPRSATEPGGAPWPDAGVLGATLALGVALGAVSFRSRRRRPPP